MSLDKPWEGGSLWEIGNKKAQRDMATSMKKHTSYTFCENCQHVMNNGQPYAWTCHTHPKKEGFGFVTEKLWDNESPFKRCSGINGGACPMYKEKENGKD